MTLFYISNCMMPGRSPQYVVRVHDSLYLIDPIIYPTYGFCTMILDCMLLQKGYTFAISFLTRNIFLFALASVGEEKRNYVLEFVLKHYSQFIAFLYYNRALHVLVQIIYFLVFYRL